MGAWGEGMLANDTALDYVHGIKKDMAKAFRESEAWQASNAHDERDHAILGMAQYLLESGEDVPEDLVERVRAMALSQKRRKKLDTWRDPELREAALDRFLALLAGEGVSEEELASDNEGLLSRMARLGGS